MASSTAVVINIFEVGDFEAQIRRGVEALQAGGLVLLPTETVYGAAGILTHAGAHNRLKALRGGDGSKPFTIHLSRREDAEKYLGSVSELGRRMMTKLWPGPVGLCFDVPADRRAKVCASLHLPESELYTEGAITLRCPDHIVTREMIGQIEAPVVLTAVGNGGSTPMLKADALPQEFQDKVDLVFDAGPGRYSKPSTLVKIRGDGYEIVRTGVYDERIIQRLLRTTVLFVCSGNTCRSPMAEALGRKLLADKLKVTVNELEARGIYVISAGSFAMPGARATPAAVEAVRELGADLSKHRSRPLSVELIHQADAIFAMGKSHLQAISAMVPGAMEKASTLDPAGDIEDPIGAEVSVYKTLAGKLRGLIARRFIEAKLSSV